VRYFLDTEYNGFGGELLSLALVPDNGDELYLTLRVEATIKDWVQRHVVPYLDAVPEQLSCPRLSRHDAAHELERYLHHDREPLIHADWPEDVSQFCDLMMTGEGKMVDIRHLTFRLRPMSNFSTAANSKVPHNALHDARALRDHILAIEP
jgi:hypothetical protein